MFDNLTAKQGRIGVLLLLACALMLLFVGTSWARKTGQYGGYPVDPSTLPYRIVPVSIDDSGFGWIFHEMEPDPYLEAYRVIVQLPDKQDRAFTLFYLADQRKAHIMLEDDKSNYGRVVAADNPEEAVYKFMSGQVPAIPTGAKEEMPGLFDPNQPPFVKDEKLPIGPFPGR
jgi:hypothetical protein